MELKPIYSQIIALWISFLATCYSAETSNEQAFRDHLSNKPPIKLLRFTETDCQSKQQRHFLAAVDTNGFFLREYAVAEDPSALISTTNKWTPTDHFCGQNGDTCWLVNSREIHRTSRVDPVGNWLQMDTRTARALLNTVLNLGVDGWNVQRGFVWNRKDQTRFTAPIAENAVMKIDGREVTNVSGKITISNELVSKLEMNGDLINYEYAPNLNCPPGLPTKIIVGPSASSCYKLIEIEDLVYGHSDESAFVPEAKFVSTNFVSVVLVTNAINRDLQRPHLPAVSQQLHVQKKTTLLRTIILGVMCGIPVVLFLIFRTGRTR